MISRLRAGLAVLLAAPLLVACGGGDSESESEFPPIDNTEEVQNYYENNPEFFTFSSPDAIPDDLEWEDGMDLPPIGSSQATKGGTQYGAIQDFPRTLRLVGPDSNGSFRSWLLDDVALSLAHLHPETEERRFYPALADEWAVDYDDRRVYARLDPDARWSDGERVTAEDFMFMFYFYQSDYIVAPWYNNYYSTYYDNITRYDEHTISIQVSEAKPDLNERVLGLSPVPRHFYRELGEDFVQRYQWRFTPTTGAYVVRDENIRRGRSIALTRLEDWWAKDNKYFRNRYNMDRVQLNVIRESNNRFQAFRRGDIDQFGMDLAEFWYDKMPNDDPLVQNGYIHKSVFYNQRPRPNYGLWMNTGRELLSNRQIRLGIQYATNWNLVIDRFFRGDYRRMDTAQDGFGEFTNPDIDARPFDIDQAMEHFAAAGFDERDEEGILVNDEGQRLAFTLSTGYRSMSEVLTILQEEARQAGLRFRVEVLDSTTGWKKVQEKRHDIYFAAFNVSDEMYPRFWDYYHSENAYDQAFLEDGGVNPERELKVQTNNLESFAEPEMDAMIEQYVDSTSREEMIELAHEMQAFHHDYASFVPGFVQGFYRLGHWRWVRYPEFFNHRRSGSAGELHIHWIDQQMKEETLQAQQEGRSFDPRINVYDRFQVDE